MSTDDPADDRARDAAAAPAAAPPTMPAARRSGPRRAARWLVGTLAALVLAVVLAAAALVWALNSATGTARLLALVPQLTVVEPQGALLGDFAAARLDIAVPGAGTLRLVAPRWRALAASRGSGGRWLHLTIDTLHAERAVWIPSVQLKPASSEPGGPPSTLRLPLELEVRQASVDELRVGSDAAMPIRDLRARVHLGADGGARHVLDALAARIDRGRASGAVTVAADAPFAVTAQLAAASIDSVPAWQASATVGGTLAALDVAATARVPASTTHAAQALDARGVVRPFAAWPLGELQATVDALDLSAFASVAPATALSGHAVATTSGSDVPAQVDVDLRNGRAGRWNEGLLPVTRVQAELRARPDAPEALDVRTLVAELGSASAPGGRVEARGSWTPERWQVEADLVRLRPAALDARGPETSLDGRVSAQGSGFAAASGSGAASAPAVSSSAASGAAVASPAETWAIELSAQLAGLLADKRLPSTAPRDARLQLDAEVRADAVTLRRAEARLGDARASVNGKLSRRRADDPWRAAGRLQLADFDPAPWWPGAGDGAGGPLAGGPTKLNAKGEFDLVLPAALGGTASVYAQVSATRGKAELSVVDSTFGGVAVGGEAAYANSDGSARPTFDVLVGGNRVQGQGRIAAAGASDDDWQLVVDAPRLATLAPWVAAPAPAPPAGATGRASSSSSPAVAGTLTARAHVAGRWPDVTSDGELQGAALRYGGTTVRQAAGRWRLGSSADAALDGTLTLDDIVVSGRAIERVQAQLAGTAKAHRAELRVASAALPPEWVDALVARAPPAAGVAIAAAAAATGNAPPDTTSGAIAASPASPAAGPPANARSALSLVAEGGLVDADGAQAAGWRGSVRELRAQSLAGPARTWLALRDLRGSVFWSGGPMRASLEPGSAEALGATLRWSRVAWQQGDAGAPARLDVQAAIDAFPVAPVLRALQPSFGWGGDLAVAARIDVRSTPTVKVDVAVERTGGDLNVTDEVGTQQLGFSELRLGVVADAGVWRFSGGVAGSTLGVASAAVTARTSGSSPWPEAATPIEGVAELRVANLGTWGNWVPAGWRLAGELHANAAIGGRFGAPEYTGRVDGSKLGVRNFLEGVNVTDGALAIALQGTTARIERFDAKGGAGTVKLEGEAAFDEAPTAKLRLTASRFELLGRVDRRIVTSGNAALRLDAKTLGLSGDFKVDEGVVDFTRSDAPKLGEDVEVVRRPKVESGSGAVVAASNAAGPTTRTMVAAAAAASAAASAPVRAAAAAAATATASVNAPVAAATSASAAAPSLAAPAARAVDLDLRVDMGRQLRVRGRGLDAGLRGELHITSPGGRLAVAGSLATRDGTYQAYGQKLGIDRGVLTFVGPIENPRLDIEATRPDVDVRVGVVVGGTALNPRIRLFSEPDMSDIDKLSWLVLGRASTTTGGTDTAILQQAALALLSGEGPGVTDRLIQSIGLDTVDVRQSQQGGVKDTIVTLGKQISKRWYVGFERGLNTTTGTWQLIYRVAQRVTIKAEAGSDNAVDVNWTLRWK